MKKLKVLLGILFICTFLSSCDKNDNETHKTKSVDLKVNELYEYDTKISGDEEGASVYAQASHFEVSEIIRDSSTNYSSVYTYKPVLDYIGADQVEIKLSTGSDGAGSSTNFEYIKINFNISK